MKKYLVILLCLATQFVVVQQKVTDIKDGKLAIMKIIFQMLV
jgi:hypothetical protein